MGLFDFLKKLPTVNELTGGFGEVLAKFYATTLPGALVLRDVLIDGAEGFTSQIDLLIIGCRGIYVIEMKTFSNAKIYGDIKKSKWRYYTHGKKYEIYSPVKQNEKHIQYLKEFLKPFGEIPCFSIVTMICDNFKISGEPEADTVICNSLPSMEKAIYQIAEGNPELFDEEKKKEIYEYIKEHQHIGRDARIAHKKNVISYKNSLEEMKREKKCPHCKSNLVLRRGKNGTFYGCSGFPKCRYTEKCEEKL